METILVWQTDSFGLRVNSYVSELRLSMKIDKSEGKENEKKRGKLYKTFWSIIVIPSQYYNFLFKHFFIYLEAMGILKIFVENGRYFVYKIELYIEFSY